MQIMYQNPGQQVTVLLETFGSDGYRTDSPEIPLVSRIILPSLTLAASYPQAMNKLDDGLYYYKFTLPSGPTSLGTYIVDLEYIDPLDSLLKILAYQIVVNATTGNLGLTSSF